MISLKRNEEIEVFQVQLSLKLKTKQSPFISILILAKELGKIDAISLQANLLSSLPERACSNLLNRLSEQNYLNEIQYGNSSSYTLTESGEKSALDKSFWIGEKGLYNVYISKSKLIEQKILRTEKVERAEDSKNAHIILTPSQIKQYQNKILNINQTEVLIEDIEERCFHLNAINSILEIQTNESETVLNIKYNNQTLFQTDTSFDESFLQEELLESSTDFEYDKDKKAILSSFDKENLSFQRRVKINKPIFKGIQFNLVELEKIAYMPSSQNEAIKWYWELLFQNSNSYFLSEESFQKFAIQNLQNFHPQYKNIKPPSRSVCIDFFKGRSDAFYQIAKLETIDYLNY